MKDFGKSQAMLGYIFKEYWEYIGTVHAFFEANLALVDLLPLFNFLDRASPIYTRAPCYLPPSKVNRCDIGDGYIFDELEDETMCH